MQSICKTLKNCYSLLMILKTKLKKTQCHYEKTNEKFPKKTMGFPVISVPLGFYPEGTPIEHDSGGLVTWAPGIPSVSNATLYIILLYKYLFSSQLLYPLLHQGLLRWKAPADSISLLDAHRGTWKRASAAKISHNGTQRCPAKSPESLNSFQ